MPIGDARGAIYIDDTNKISFKLGIGRDTNNKAYLSALWETMKLASDKHNTRLHIYGDSKTIIDWEIGKNNIRSPHLHNLLKEIRDLQPTFETVLFSHVYREFNIEADTMSKKALAIQPGII